MSTVNTVLMQNAKESLKGKWRLAIGTFVVYFLTIGVIQSIPKIGQVAVLVIGGPMMLGFSLFTLSLARNKDAKLEQIFQGFNYFANSLVTYLLMILFILLWTLLLIIPGIIAALSYSMSFFILADNNTLGSMDVLKKSKAMMNGYKKKLFYMLLRFFGLSLLCILTLGIGFLWLIPYMNVSLAKFYDDIKDASISQ